jgi:hypothetical protein
MAMLDGARFLNEVIGRAQPGEARWRSRLKTRFGADQGEAS